MQFRDFLRIQEMTYDEFGALINYSGRYLNMLVHGHYPPGKKVKKIIEDATSGDVKGHEIYSPAHDYRRCIGARKYAKEGSDNTLQTQTL